jgi:hypothetical protein
MMNVEHLVEGGLTEETEVLGEKPFCLPQELTWARTRAAAVGSRRLTA